jgi:hypothetical protein
LTVITFRYPAFMMLQTPTSKPLILFAAPAPEIGKWVGIPQRGRLGGEETVGFQRQENETRVRELAGFFTEPRNVVQNALLCALQDTSSVEFTPSSDGSSFGELVIDAEVLPDLSLLELIDRVITRLEARVATLGLQPLDDGRLANALKHASEKHDLIPADSENDESPEEEVDLDAPADDALGSDQEGSEGDVAAVLLSEETQLMEFHQELKIRAEVLRRLPAGSDPNELLGFTKDAMIGYLQPVVLVDGQHRLRGAIKSAEDAVNSESGREEVRQAINGGATPDEAQDEAIDRHSRRLPVSLLMDDSPSEHVFQFVVVNQKATPMGKALLGTIVSTSLSLDELEPVAQRLHNAGIRLEDSQAVAYLTRAPDSPFHKVVQTGVSGDSGGHLQWNVLKGLTTIFRELRGGRLYHQKVDYADKWRRQQLADSDFVSVGSDDAEKYAIWSAQDGPWREVFIRFYELIKQRFGTDDPNANNAWGDTSKNLFNQVTLTILAADYFQFLCDAKKTLNKVDDVDQTVDEWLEDVNNSYFAKDWNLPKGLKKAQAPVQKAWASTWLEYRKDPKKLPNISNYRPK